MDYRIAISCGWAVIWALIARFTLTIDEDHQLAICLRLLMAAVALIWAGMIFGISFLEAWVKFGAGLATRPVGVDIGGRVFRALNSAELVHCAVLDLLYARLRLAGVRVAGASGDGILVLLTAIVGCQGLWLTPKLVENAAWCVANAEDGEIPPCKDGYRKEVKSLVAGRGGRRPMVHLAYVAMEVAKIGLLLGMSAWSVAPFLLLPG